MGEDELAVEKARKTTTKRASNVGRIPRVLAMLTEEEEGKEGCREEWDEAAMEV